jgi:hypothetical protein
LLCFAATVPVGRPFVTQRHPSQKLMSRTDPDDPAGPASM